MIATPADELHAAAQKLRALAAAVPPPPWTPGGIGDYGWTVHCGDPANRDSVSLDTCMDNEAGQALTRFIAAMHPGVAEAIATWLESWTGIDINEHGPMPDDLAHALTVAHHINQD